MDERVKIESILKRIDTLREEVASLLPKPEPVVAPESEPVVVVKSQPIVRVSLPKAPMPSPEPDAFERFINRVGDWFAVRGDFALCILTVASLFLFIYVSAESGWIGRLYLPTLKTGLMTLVWAGTAFGLLALGIVRRLRAVRFVGLGLLGLSVAKVLLIDTASLATPGRVGVFAVVGILLIVGAFLYLRFRKTFLL